MTPQGKSTQLLCYPQMVVNIFLSLVLLFNNSSRSRTVGKVEKEQRRKEALLGLVGGIRRVPTPGKQPRSCHAGGCGKGVESSQAASGRTHGSDHILWPLHQGILDIGGALATEDLPSTGRGAGGSSIPMSSRDQAWRGPTYPQFQALIHRFKGVIHNQRGTTWLYKISLIASRSRRNCSSSSCRTAILSQP